MAALAPRYLASFRCLGEACEDHCCRRWTIPVNRADFRRVRERLSAEPGGETALRRGFERHENASAGHFATLRFRADGNCHFLGERGLCTLHARFGAEILPYICAVYPRFIQTIDGVTEITASTSCPEVARRLLAEPDPCALVAYEAAPLPHSEPTRTLATAGAGAWSASVPRVRAFALSILDARGEPLEVRLFVLAYALGHLGARLDPSADRSVLATLDDELARLGAPGFMRALAEEYARLEMTSPIALRLVHEVLCAARADETRVEFRALVTAVFGNFAGGAFSSRDPADLTEAELRALWEEHRARATALTRAAGPWLDEAFTRLAANYWLQALHTGSPSLVAHHQKLLSHLAIVRFLLASHPQLTPRLAEGTLDEVFLRERLVDVVYRVARRVEHSTLLQRVTGLLQDSGLENLAGSVALLRT